MLIPQYVNRVIYTLETNGYEAFIVGGSVRDLLLGKEPSDYDITTNATPDEILELFTDYKTIFIGKEYGTVVVVQLEGNIEVTTYRKEGEYIDGRRPSEVFFTKDILEDLSRRDFTINSMAYNNKVGVLDPFGGKKDLDNKIIKTVGDPHERLREDHLRILRAVRFSSQLGFEIEEETRKACKSLGHSLKCISSERIRDELFKILLSKVPSKGIILMKDLDILEVVIPELVDAVGFDQHNPHHDKNVFDHILCVIDNAPQVLSVRLAALFHDIGKPHTLTIDKDGIGHFYGHDKVGAEIGEQILIRLKASNDLISKVTTLVKEHMTHHAKYKEKGLKKQISRVGKDEIFNLLSLQKADRICSSSNVDITFLKEREELIKKILENNEPYEKKQLKIDGNDIISLGYTQGKEIGEILDYLMDKVLGNPELNQKDKLIKMIQRKYGGKTNSEQWTTITYEQQKENL